MILQVRILPDIGITWGCLTGANFRHNDKQLFRRGVDGG